MFCALSASPPLALRVELRALALSALFLALDKLLSVRFARVLLPIFQEELFVFAVTFFFTFVLCVRAFLLALRVELSALVLRSLFRVLNELLSVR